MLISSIASFALLFSSQSMQNIQLGGGEIEEALAREIDHLIQSSKTPIQLELCVADALAQRSFMPSAFHGPNGSIVVVNERHSVTITPNEAGSQIAVRARGNADERIANAIRTCS